MIAFIGVKMSPEDGEYNATLRMIGKLKRRVDHNEEKIEEANRKINELYSEREDLSKKIAALDEDKIADKVFQKVIGYLSDL